MKKILWVPKICIQKNDSEHEIIKLEGLEDRASAVRIAEEIFDKTTGAAWFGVERVEGKV